MATKYTYLLGIGPEPYFDNSLNVDQFQKEVEASAISVLCTHIRNIGTNVDVWFDSALSAPEITILDGLVTAHLLVPIIDPYEPTVSIDKITNPLYTDDNTKNYEIGSRWFNVLTDEEFVCLDATTNNAIWKSTSGYTAKEAFNPQNFNDSTQGYIIGSRWLNTTTGVEFICTDTTLNNAIWKETVIVNAVQTLTNKTLTGAIIEGGTIGNTTPITVLKVDNITIDGNTLLASDVNGDLILSTNGTGNIKFDTIGTGVINANTNQIINLADPIGSQDAATKNYVDSMASGLTIKSSVRLATTEELPLNASISNGTIIYPLTINDPITATLNVSDTFIVDGVTLGMANDGTRILLKDESIGINDKFNGIWTTAINGTTLTLTRASDFDQDAEVIAGLFMFIVEGTTNADNGFVLITNDPIVLGTTSLQFTQFSGTGQIIAGDGLKKTGNTMDADLKPNGGIVVELGQLALDLGASNITGNLAVVDGGTGNTTLTSNGVLIGQGTNAVDTSKSAPTGDFVGTNDTQTLTNKTLTTPIISQILNTGTLTLPTLTDTLVGRTTTDTLTNKTLTNPNINGGILEGGTIGNTTPATILKVDNIIIDNNTISTTTGNLILTPNGSNVVAINNITIGGDTISTTDTNGNLILAPNGTGKVAINNITVGGNTITTTDTNGNLILSANGTGTVNVKGIKNYGASATDPVSPAPADGDIYYNTVLHMEMQYDSFRSKWLSTATFIEGFGRGGTTFAGQYYTRHGLTLTASTGPYIPKGTITYIGYTTSATATHTLEIIVNGIAVAELASGGGTTASSFTLNGDYLAGNMASRCKTGSAATTNLQCVVYYKLRV